MKKGDISKFVEEAVRWRVLDRVVSEVKTRNAGVSARKIQAAVDEALAAVRAERLVPDADYLVTGDRSGLLTLKHHGKTRIVTARQFSTAVTPKPRLRTRSR